MSEKEPMLQRGAFIHRIKPSGIDKLQEALNGDQLLTGWAAAPQLLDPKLDRSDFTEVIHSFKDGASSRIGSGQQAGYMWAFIRLMKKGDLVLVPVPHGALFAEVTGDIDYSEAHVDEDTSYRRTVRWLNDKEPVPKSVMPANLRSYLKFQGTTVSISHLVPECEEILAAVAGGRATSFAEDLREHLAQRVRREITDGKMDEREFERLVAVLLAARGAVRTEIRSDRKNADKGADVVAWFEIGGVSPAVLAVQAKWYKPDPPVGCHVVDELLRGMEAEQADYGWIVTAGTISGEVEEYVEKLEARIDLIDGLQLGRLILESGLGSMWVYDQISTA